MSRAVARMARRSPRASALFFAASVLAACLASCTTPATRPAALDAAARKAAIDAAFEDVMARYRLPGLALGVVENGEIVYVRTAGETVAGSGPPITPDTLFKIASNTKAMTTGVLARLVDAGKLRWDDPVVKHLPGFRMSDPWVTREMQVRDLLIHNSGLRAGAGDLMLWPEPNAFTRADVLAGLGHLRPVHSFRSRYEYDNLLYIVAGEVAAAAAGSTYEELVRREVFEPLGMTRCVVGTFRPAEVGNVAQPHMRSGDGNVAVREDGEVVPAITSAAAGGIRCSLNDMLKWMRMWLDPALKPPGRDTPWISPAQRDAVWAAQMPMSVSRLQREWNNTHVQAYGYGWRLADVDGVKTVSHTGTLLGMYSAFTLVPERNAGFVFMINGDGSKARVVLTQTLLKLITAPERAQRAAVYAAALEQSEKADAAQAQRPVDLPRAPARPSELGQRLGLYRDPWFGEVSICARDEGVRFAAAKSPLLSGAVLRAGERWLVDWDDPSVDAEAWLDFAAAPSADASRPDLTMAKVDPEADFSYDFEDLRFRRVGDCAVPESAGENDMQSEIDALMQRYQGAVPGASVLVVRDGRPLVRRSYGLADLEAQVAATPVTNYRLASVTKQFTAAAVLLLVQDGKLRLDDRARRWLPALPQAADAVTLRHLLTHTSGLIDYEDVIPDGTAVPLHDADVLELLSQQDRTYFPPGSAYRYSNSGYALLALIVERASGQSFARFLRERIFAPLGMQNTVAHEEGVSTVAHRAYGYSLRDAGWERTDQSLTSAVLGDGGIYSSIDDLARWDQALYDDRLLDAASRRLAFTPATATDAADVQYGFGWRITGETVWHSGETIGFRNVIVRYPERRLTVIVLTNRDDPEPYPVALEIASLALASPHAAP